jgi:hypothetical protein
MRWALGISATGRTEGVGVVRDPNKPNMTVQLRETEDAVRSDADEARRQLMAKRTGA